jgi:hypothetical protein
MQQFGSLGQLKANYVCSKCRHWQRDNPLLWAFTMSKVFRQLRWDIKFEMNRFETNEYNEPFPQRADTFKRKVDAKHNSMKRHYPTFYAGLTTTADYVREYASINEDKKLIALEYVYADRLAPIFDPTQPEVLEDVNPDAEDIEPVKVKKPKTRAAKIEALLREVLSMIDDGEPPSPSGDWATEARGLL